jgi:hypothetical protein
LAGPSSTIRSASRSFGMVVIESQCTTPRVIERSLGDAGDSDGRYDGRAG